MLSRVLESTGENIGAKFRPFWGGGAPPPQVHTRSYRCYIQRSIGPWRVLLTLNFNSRCPQTLRSAARSALRAARCALRAVLLLTALRAAHSRSSCCSLRCAQLALLLAALRAARLLLAALRAARSAARCAARSSLRASILVIFTVFCDFWGQKWWFSKFVKRFKN